MQKLTLKLDLTKINKDRIQTETFTKRDGTEHTAKYVMLDFVPQEPEVLKQYETAQLIKAGFVAETTKKEERDAGYKGAILGNATYYLNSEPNQAPQNNVIQATDLAAHNAKNSLDNDIESIPF
jgi:hypothetical protein